MERSLGRQAARLPFPGCGCDRRDRRVPCHRRGSLAPPPLAGRRAPRRASRPASAGTPRRHRRSAASASSPGSSPASLAALAVGAVEWSGELGGILAGVALLFVGGARRRPPPPEPAREARRADRRRRHRARERARGRDRRRTTSSRGGSGSSGSSGSRTRSTCSTTWTASRRRSPRSPARYFAIDAVTEHETRPCSCSRSRSALACAGFLPFNLRPGRGARVFMGDSGSQVLGFGLASLALASSWTVAGTTVATILLPLLVLAIPILDTTLVTLVRLAERRPVTPGRARPHLAPARLLRALGGEGGAAARARRGGDRRDGARLQRPRQRPADGARRARHLRPARPVRRASSAISRSARAAEPRRRSRRSGGRSCSSRAASSRSSSTSSSSARSFLAAYLLVVGGHRHASSSARSSSRRCRSCSRRATSSSSRSASTGGCGASRPRATCSRSRSAAPRRRSSPTSCSSRCEPIGSFPALEIFVVDAVLAHVARRRLAADAAASPRGCRARRRHRRRVLVVGAGAAGRGLARELRESHEARVVGFLDDNPRVRRRRILGITVVGSIDEAAARDREHAGRGGARHDPRRRAGAARRGRARLGGGGRPVPDRPAHTEFSAPEPVEASLP